MKKAKYVAAVFSMKPKWLKKHPNAAKLRVRILSKAKFDRIVDGEKLPKRFRRWVEEEGVAECETELNAWEAAIAIQERLVSQRRKADLKFGKSNCRLYVFQMEAAVADEPKFSAMNPALPGNENGTCVYVGMTSATTDDRTLTVG